MRVSREQVLAYRVAAQQLDRSASDPLALRVLDIGVQDAPGQQALLAFAARLDTAPDAHLIGTGAPLALTWSLRGAPYVHRRSELAQIAAALFPLSEADATVRLNETGPSVARAELAALDQYRAAVRAMRDAIRTPIAKGAASTAVTQAIPKVMWRECRACATSHISDSAMRVSSLAAGVELEPGTSPPVLRRWSGSKLVRRPDAAALRGLARAYLSLLGPATPVQVSDYLGVRRADLTEAWPEDLTEVQIDGVKGSTWLPSDCAAYLESAPEPDVVRLLGGFDPYLQARDRDLIIPNSAAQKALWPVLGRPGVVFVDGEVLGIWRPKASGAKLTLQVDAFAPLPPAVWSALEAEGERVAAVRGKKLAAIKAPLNAPAKAPVKAPSGLGSG